MRYALEILEFEDMSSNGKDYEILTTNLGEKLKILFDKIKKVLSLNFYSDLLLTISRIKSILFNKK
jgi:hypothetical protein